MVNLNQKAAAPAPNNIFSQPINFFKNLGSNVGKKFNTQKNKVVSNIKKLAYSLGIKKIKESTKKNLLKNNPRPHDMSTHYGLPHAAKVGGSKRGKKKSKRRRRQLKRRTRK